MVKRTTSSTKHKAWEAPRYVAEGLGELTRSYSHEYGVGSLDLIKEAAVLNGCIRETNKAHPRIYGKEACGFPRATE